MFRKIVPVLLVALLLSLAGCATKDAEIDAFVKDLDGLTTDMVKAIEASPNTAGIDAAQKLLDAKKAGLKAKVTEFKSGNFRASEAAVTKLTNSFTDSAKRITDLSTKITDEAIKNNDTATPTKFAALLTSYSEIYQ
jgi:type IV pilus biogenesis protein CpaD/CtpE